ncbi:MAG: hypothetical protein V3S24_04355 [Candidatus Tectomicrobia bacterium]
MPVSDRLIETTILVDVLRGKEEAIAWVNSVSPRGRWVSAVTYFELLAGCRNRREQRAVGREMGTYRLLHVFCSPYVCSPGIYYRLLIMRSATS